MIAICIIHNEERDRLGYLRPRLEQLVHDLAADSHQSEVRYVGPDASGMAGRVPLDTQANRCRRAFDLATVNVSNWDPRKPESQSGKMRAWFEIYFKTLEEYRRPLVVEQEVLEAHKFCWAACAQLNDFMIVLESDAKFRVDSAYLLSVLLRFIRSSYQPSDVLYVDLAGGFDHRVIFGSWNFEAAYGCRTFSLPNCAFVKFHQLKRWTGNTVGGYLLSPGLARLLLEEAQARPVMLPPDWAMNAYASRNQAIGDGICIHSTPTIFTQGSLDGSYASGIERASLPRS
jgi:hypothetical protein